MKNILKQFDWHPSNGTLVAGFFVILGFILSGINWWFISLAAFGTFGPGILREVGLLNDQDEFQRRATRKAGYHAFLTVGLVTFLLVGYFKSGTGGLDDPEALVTLILAILWFTWFLSSLLSYWGVQQTTSRLLYTFGTVWLIFTIIGNIQTPVILLMQSILVMPFFLMAYMSKKWPAFSGILLIILSIILFFYLGLDEIMGSNPLEKGRGEVIVLFVGPLLVCGILLLRSEFGKGNR